MHSALLRFLVLLRFFFRRLLFFRLVRFGPRVLLLLCAWFGRRGPTLRLRTLALRRSHRPLSWLIPVGLWPIIRLGLSLRPRCGLPVWFRSIRLGLSVRFSIRLRLVWSG